MNTTIIEIYAILSVLYIGVSFVLYVSKRIQDDFNTNNTVADRDDNSQSDTVDPNVDDYQPIIPAIEEWEEGKKERQSGDNDSQSDLAVPDTDVNQPNNVIEIMDERIQSRDKVAAQILNTLEASVTVKVITDDMLLSKKGRILTGSARQARIDKLIKEGYELI